MATTFPTLIDIATLNGGDPVVGLIDEAMTAYPEISGRDPMTGNAVPGVGAARTIPGTSYKTTVRTGDPTVAFRDANEGVAGTKGTFENRIVSTYTLNPRFECDKAVADRHIDGPEAYLALEGAAQLRAAFRTLGKQFYYGTSNDAKGFPGLLAAYDTTNMVVDAAGPPPSTGSSVWGVKFGPQFVQWVYGENGMLDLGDVRVESITDASSNRFDAYVQSFLAYPGLQVGHSRSVGRIKKLTADSGKGLTDDLMYQLIATFPTSVGNPDVFFMTRRSLMQLRRSRTATNATGAPAPIPTEVNGIPIVVTDSLVDTEALTL